jgi:tetratricopeptide (TPR) repeat protein
MSGKPDQAIELLSDALTQNGSDNRLYLERADAKQMKGDYPGAITDYTSANSLVQNSGEYGLARIYSLKGDVSAAVYHLERNLSSAFRKSEKEILLDPSFSVIENRPEWRQILRKEWYTDSERRIDEIEYYAAKGNLEEAKILLSGLRSDYKTDSPVLYGEALISHAEGRFADAVTILSGLVTSDEKSERYLRLLAKAQTGNKNPSGASDVYTKMLNLEIPDAGLLLSRAECYLKTGETDKASGDLERYLSINPGDKDAISLAGRVEVASGDNLKALSYFSRNLELHPGDPACYTDRANAYFLSKTWDWAIKDYTMALDLNPDNSEVWLSKGISLLNSGKKDDACHDFRRSFSLGNKKAADFISRNCIK